MLQNNTYFTKEDVHYKLLGTDYLTTDDIEYALSAALSLNKPLLLEGEAGVGKTALAKAVAEAFGYPLIRTQMYDGLTDDKILYDVNYQKQLLTIDSVRPILERETRKMSMAEAAKKVGEELDLFGKDYLIERPILKSINGTGKKVLLIDELDKAPEEIEYMLFEFLENYSISIPEYGEIKCPADQKPIVIITSNGYRDLSHPLKRRCVYLYIKPKTMEEYIKILTNKALLDENLAHGIAMTLVKAGNADLKQTPSIAEAIEWGKYLSSMPTLTKDLVVNSFSLITKNEKDLNTMRGIISSTFEF